MDNVKTKATTILKDYVSQMRAAGFEDNVIRAKLLNDGNVFIPDELPQNFGQQTWAAGMKSEFRGMPSNKELPSFKVIPSPNKYMEYMQGYSPNRIPTYQEFSNRNQPMGRFKGTQNTNLMAALQKRLEGYQGPKIGASQQSYQMGIVGMPQNLANQWIPEYLKIAEDKANEARETKEYEDLQLRYPEIDIQPGDSADAIAQKIMEYNQNAAYQKEAKDPFIISALNNAVYQATIEDKSISIEDVMNEALINGLKLSYDQAMAIFTSAKNKALADKKNPDYTAYP